ncbi:uncharacterized protein LOC118464738 isoform X2 [Anopheles albimanus]|uniref:uncharacterized protein LOC118464738 isoform X2 n=1 Tax=Anopheles albimanus TaxID=7167 RepID=UPI001641A5BB|nr:uncharacterized protein LOC118464738 isoform X2 [Anopheles albimanus]
MKTGYGLNTADTLGYLGYGAKPYSSLNYLGSKGYSSTSAGLRTKNAYDKDSIMSKVKKPKLRKTPTEKPEVPLYKKKTYDFTDYAYREAVNRLKFLLTEAYEPTKAATSFFYRNVDVDGKSEVSDNQSVIERPSLTEVSKYFPSSGGLTAHRYGGTLARRYSFLGKDLGGVSQSASGSALKPAISNSSLQPAASGHGLEIAQPPPELLGFIEKQESYIEQLERESQYCREELSTLLKKVKDVVSENEALTDRSRMKALYQLDSSESEDVDYDRGRDKGKPLTGPSIVFESRISELEAQLAQSQIDLKRLFTENEENKRKLLNGASDVGNADAYRKQVENLQRDKQNLEETVRKLQLSIDQLKDSEACNFSKSQRSRDMIEQVAFERNQAEIEIRRLKDELERQHERVREVQHEMAKRIAEERASAERRYTYHVDQLGGDLSSQWDHATKLQLEVERMKRIESDHKRELTQKNSQIDELKMEIKNKTAIFMSDLNQASAEKQSLEQEITSLRLQLERTERQSKVEVSRLNAEITSLRQRLDRADADLLQSKRENLKLGDEVASLEKELTLGELNRETRPSKELAKIISDMENKHANTVSELEGMIQDQKQLMEKLTAECKSLTHKLEDTTQKHKEEKVELRKTNSELMERLKQIWSSYKQLSPAFRDSSMRNTDDNDGDNYDDTPELQQPADDQADEGDRMEEDDLEMKEPLVADHAPEVLPPDILQPPLREPTMMTRRWSVESLPATADDSMGRVEAVNLPDPSLGLPIGSSTPRSNRPSYHATTPSSTMPIHPEEQVVEEEWRKEASPSCPAARSPTTMVRREEPATCVALEASRRSQSMDVLLSRSDCLEQVTPLNRTVPLEGHREAVDDCPGNRWQISSEPHVSRCSHWRDPRAPDTDRNRRLSTVQPSLTQYHRSTLLNSNSSSNMKNSPTSSNNPESNNISRWPTNQPCTAMEPCPDMIPRSSSSTIPMAVTSTISNSSNKHTTSSSTRAINNHMIHSSTPLSKFMMNRATPTELERPRSPPLQCSISKSRNLLHQPQLNPHPLPPPFYHHNHRLKHRHLQPSQHQPQQHQQLLHQHRPEPIGPANSSQQQENRQALWNRRKATELWAVHGLGHHLGPVLTTGSDTSNPQEEADGKARHVSRNSLPRAQHPRNCDFQPIDRYPTLSISSPSLFGSSPDTTSLTPSPTTTVLKNYDAASPNPR